MATFVRVGGNLPAVNMDHVVDIDWADEEKGKVALTMLDGSVKFFSGDQALRVLVWVKSHGGLPMLPARS